MWNLFIISLIPLILFAIINYYTNLKTSVITSIISAILMFFLGWLLLDWFDHELILMIIVMVIFGIIAIKKDNEFYFKLQPAVSGLLICLIVLYFEIFDESLLFKLLPTINAHLPANASHLLKNKRMQETFHTLFLHGTFWIALHSILLAWSAKYSSTKTWLLLKAFFLPVFLVIMTITLLFMQNPLL